MVISRAIFTIASRPGVIAEAYPILRAGRMGDYLQVRPDMMFEMIRPR